MLDLWSENSAAAVDVLSRDTDHVVPMLEVDEAEDMLVPALGCEDDDDSDSGVGGEDASSSADVSDDE